MKTVKIFLKIIIFTAIFFILSYGVALLFKDDANSYSRALTHEFYNQKNIDVLFCGASHVSHGINPEISDKAFNSNTFNTGTPSQGINGTYAIIRQAIKSYKISKIYLETDFAITCDEGKEHLEMGKADFIVSNFLKDFSIKKDFIIENSSPDNILNAILPIGKDKLMTLSPEKLTYKIKSIINKEYFKYSYGNEDSGYAGKGCVLDYNKIENGTFSNDHKEPSFKPVSEYWKKYIIKIADLCKSNNIELVFFSMPGSDFYLHEKGDYDTFYNEINDFITNLGYEYYDFNLTTPKYTLEDEDYSDDNHMNINGIEKFSNIFCDFFNGKISKEEMFYSSYKEKCENQGERVYGLLIIKSESNDSFEIIPVKNDFSDDSITYDVTLETFNGKIQLAEHSKETKYDFPKGTSGSIIVKCFINNNQVCQTSQNYASF